MIQLSLGAYRGVSHEAAIHHSQTTPVVDPCLGPIGVSKLQLCPQGINALTPESCTELVKQYPTIQFRPHANIRVYDTLKIIDAVTMLDEEDYVIKVGEICKALNATGYTLHPGVTSDGSLQTVFRTCLELTDRYGIPVGVEGMYPAVRMKYHLSSWREYEQLLGAGVYYAIDLSHLHILKTRTGILPLGLVCELLSHPLCMEVHVSGNDGRSDQHTPIDKDIWWLPLLPYVQDTTTIYYEGSQRGLLV